MLIVSPQKMIVVIQGLKLLLRELQWKFVLCGRWKLQPCIYMITWELVYDQIFCQ